MKLLTITLTGIGDHTLRHRRSFVCLLTFSIILSHLRINSFPSFFVYFIAFLGHTFDHVVIDFTALPHRRRYFDCGIKRNTFPPSPCSVWKTGASPAPRRVRPSYIVRSLNTISKGSQTAG